MYKWFITSLRWKWQVKLRWVLGLVKGGGSNYFITNFHSNWPFKAKFKKIMIIIAGSFEPIHSNQSNNDYIDWLLWIGSNDPARLHHNSLRKRKLNSAPQILTGLWLISKWHGRWDKCTLQKYIEQTSSTFKLKSTSVTPTTDNNTNIPVLVKFIA